MKQSDLVFRKSRVQVLNGYDDLFTGKAVVLSIAGDDEVDKGAHVGFRQQNWPREDNCVTSCALLYAETLISSEHSFWDLHRDAKFVFG